MVRLLFSRVERCFCFFVMNLLRELRENGASTKLTSFNSIALYALFSRA